MKFSAIFAVIASTQAVHLTSAQKSEITAKAEEMNSAMADIQSQMEESQKTLAELQNKFDLFNPSSWWSLWCSVFNGAPNNQDMNQCMLILNLVRVSTNCWLNFEIRCIRSLTYIYFCAIIIVYPNLTTNVFF